MFSFMIMDFGSCNVLILRFYKFWRVVKYFKFPAFGNNNITTFELHSFSIYLFN